MNNEWAVLQCSFVGDNEGNLQGFDARQKQLTQTALNIHDKKINTVNVSSLLVTTRLACFCSTYSKVHLFPLGKRLGAECTVAISLSAHMLHCLAGTKPTTLPLAK